VATGIGCKERRYFFIAEDFRGRYNMRCLGIDVKIMLIFVLQTMNVKCIEME
jgi:hypothetical protein